MKTLAFAGKQSLPRRNVAPICRFDINGWEERKKLIHLELSQYCDYA